MSCQKNCILSTQNRYEKVKSPCIVSNFFKDYLEVIMLFWKSKYNQIKAEEFKTLDLLLTVIRQEDQLWEKSLEFLNLPSWDFCRLFDFWLEAGLASSWMEWWSHLIEIQ